MILNEMINIFVIMKTATAALVIIRSRRAKLTCCWRSNCYSKSGDFVFFADDAFPGRLNRARIVVKNGFGTLSIASRVLI